MDDVTAMRRAIRLGELVRLGTGGDPWVGCVVVRDGVVVGEGAHSVHGGPHAEPVALQEAGRRARGATAYVTLEPCVHHGRTPPCADALLEAGVARVVVAVEDPDVRVTGRGLDRLRQAGVEVEVGTAGPEAAEALAPYLHQRRTGFPWIVLKAAVSIDGRTAAADGSSRWITGEDARVDAHRLRALSQAVVVGSGTARLDRPRLTARGVEGAGPPPLRVVLDSRGSVPAEGPLFDVGEAPTLVVTTSRAPAEVVAAWKETGAEVEEVAPGTDGGVDLGEALGVLGRRGVVQALVEGGAAVHGSLVREGFASELVLYIGSPVLGDQGRPLFAGLDVRDIDAAPRWRLTSVDRMGGDARLVFRSPQASEVGS